MFDRRQAEGFPQMVGNERTVSSGFRQFSFVDREQNEMFEVQVPRFEYSHDLQTDGRFSVKRDMHGGEYPVDQFDQGLGLDGQFLVLDQRMETVDDGIYFK